MRLLPNIQKVENRGECSEVGVDGHTEPIQGGRCGRCQGLVVLEWEIDLLSGQCPQWWPVHRCVNCGGRVYPRASVPAVPIMGGGRPGKHS